VTDAYGVAFGGMRAISDIGDPRLVKALAHPLRVQILSTLEDRVASPSDLALELGAPLGNVSYHVRTLADLGLVKLVKRRTRRGAVEHYYQARGRAQVSNRAWAQVPGVVKRSMVAVALEQALDQAGAAAAAGGFDHEDSNLSRQSATLDAEGFNELSQAVARLHDDLAGIQERSAQRLAGAGEESAVQAGLVTMLFEAQRDGAASPEQAESRPAPKSSGARGRKRGSAG
jgi:DNA-binding transcriptional ArsR family regulator